MSTYSIFCPSCRQRTSIDPQGGSILVDGYQHRMYKCNGELGSGRPCNQIFVVKYDSTGTRMAIYPKDLPEGVDNRINTQVASNLEESLKCLADSCFRAAVVMARRSIQLICIDKGAPNATPAEKRLIKQIDWLFSQGLITSDLKDVAHEVRSIGNDGAHPADADDSVEVTEADAAEIIDLAKQFAHTLYVLPSILAERKQKAQESTQTA